MIEKEPVCGSYVRYFTGLVGTVESTIYSSSALPAPSKWGHTVQRLCKITWSQKISLDSLPTFTNDLGKIYHKLKYDVEMTCEEGTVDFTIYHQGKRVGERNVEVEYD